jgi:hypothetical protein
MMITLSLEVSQGRARRIMGRNYFGIEEAVRHFGAKPSAQDIATLFEIPFTGETLTKCTDSHVLVAVLPVSIDDIYAKVGPQFFCEGTYCYGSNEVTADCGHASWQLVRKALRPEWDWKTWEEQEALLPKGEQTAPARTMVYTMVGQCLATGERLFPLQRVRCADPWQRECGRHWRVGFFANGFCILPGSDDERNGDLSLAAVRTRN